MPGSKSFSVWLSIQKHVKLSWVYFTYYHISDNNPGNHNKIILGRLQTKCKVWISQNYLVILLLQVSHLLPTNHLNNNSGDYILLHPDTAKYIWFPDIYIGKKRFNYRLFFIIFLIFRFCERPETAKIHGAASLTSYL